MWKGSERAQRQYYKACQKAGVPAGEKKSRRKKDSKRSLRGYIHNQLKLLAKKATAKGEELPSPLLDTPAPD